MKEELEESYWECVLINTHRVHMNTFRRDTHKHTDGVLKLGQNTSTEFVRSLPLIFIHV